MDLDLTRARFDRLNKVMPCTISAKEIEATGTRTAVKEDLIFSKYGNIDGYKFSVILSKSEADKINLSEKTNNLITLSDGVEYRLKGFEKDSKDIAIRYDFMGKYGDLNE